jgi:hypothetical protein
LTHHEVLKQTESSRHLSLVADDDFSDKEGVLDVTRALEELVDDPVSHLCVVGRDGDESRLN